MSEVETIKRSWMKLQGFNEEEIEYYAGKNLGTVGEEQENLDCMLKILKLQEMKHGI